MKQIFLKSSFNLGWGSSEYRVALGGRGASSFFNTADSAKVVIPLNGIFRNLMIYSPEGLHPNYTVTMMINGIASALTCVLSDIQTQAKDIIHSVNVVAGDDIYFKIIVNPIGSGLGYPMNLSVEFEGIQQWFGIAPGGIFKSPDAIYAGGCLGNGYLDNQVIGNQLSTTYSICSTPGNLTGLRIKANTVGIGGGWLAWIRKNGINQDGIGGTINTQVALSDGIAQAATTFSLPIIIGDHLDFAYSRTGTSIGTSTHITMSCTFTPTNSLAFISTGGSNNSNFNGIEYRWVNSIQANIDENIAKCPVGPRGLIVTGLRVEVDEQNSAGGVIFVLRKNGIDTVATCTVPASGNSAFIDGLNISFIDGDFINLKSNVLNPIAGFSGNGCYWGLSMEDSTVSTPTPPDTTTNSGLYFINPTKSDKHDSYNTDQKKIPNPIIRTALIGE